MRHSHILTGTDAQLEARLHQLVPLMGTDEEDLIEDEFYAIVKELASRKRERRMPPPEERTREEERLLHESDERAAFNDRLDNHFSP